MRPYGMRNKYRGGRMPRKRIIQMETNAEYHADKDHLGSSMVRDATESLDLFRRLHHDRTEEKKQTESMLFGSLFHACALEPERFDAEYVIEPDWEDIIRKKDGSRYASVRASIPFKEAYPDWLEENKGRQPVTEKDLATANAMARSIKKSKPACDLLARCDQTETSFRWNVPGGDFRGKCRPDMHGVDARVIIDLKSAEDPTPGPWDRKAFDFGYQQQAAWYVDGVQANIDAYPWLFFFIVVGKNPPHNVYVRHMTQEAIDIGWAMNAQTLGDLKGAIEFDDWRQPAEKESTDIIVPYYIKKGKT